MLLLCVRIFFVGTRERHVGHILLLLSMHNHLKFCRAFVALI